MKYDLFHLIKYQHTNLPTVTSPALNMWKKNEKIEKESRRRESSHLFPSWAKTLLRLLDTSALFL